MSILKDYDSESLEYIATAAETPEGIRAAAARELSRRDRQESSSAKIKELEQVLRQLNLKIVVANGVPAILDLITGIEYIGLKGDLGKLSAMKEFPRITDDFVLCNALLFCDKQAVTELHQGA